MDLMHVRLAEERSTAQVKRTATFDGQQLWWEMSGPVEALPRPLRAHDLAAIALVFKAMQSGRSLHVDGPVSLELLEGLEDLVASWTMWRPDLYKRIAVTATEEVSDRDLPVGEARQAVAAFSGGVDASFTFWRHFTGIAGRGNRAVRAAVLAHGLDIPLSRQKAFDVAHHSATATLRASGVPLVKMRTNWREVASSSWQMDFGSGLAACLRNWQGTVGAGLIGSDEDYAHLVIPWGSNPITFSMLSTGNFAVVYDGAGYGRTAKVRAIGEWKDCLKNLRVCWENSDSGRNCGICEKCVRTKLNFLAAGLPLPEALSGEPDSRAILKLRARNAVQLSYLVDILAYARRAKTDGWWSKALGRAIALNKARNIARRGTSAVAGIFRL